MATPPHIGVKEGYFTWLSRQDNYPQRLGTRPRLIAQKFDGSMRRIQLRRPPVAEDVERLAVQMAEENPT